MIYYNILQVQTTYHHTHTFPIKHHIYNTWVYQEICFSRDLKRDKRFNFSLRTKREEETPLVCFCSVSGFLFLVCEKVEFFVLRQVESIWCRFASSGSHTGLVCVW